MSKNKKSNKVKENHEDSFFDKMKNDKKYSAKVQIVGWGVFVLLVIIFLNINSVSTTGNSVNSNTVSNMVDDSGEEEVQEEVTILKRISNNYVYDVNVSVTKSDNEVINQYYYGKSYDNNIEINKKVNDTLSKYYEVDGYYYIKNENNEFGLIQSNMIYDLIEGKYIELDDVLKLINKASLDHVINSSNDDKESVYNLLVRDVVISNKSEDVVTINVIEGTDKLSISIDYTNLMKVFDDTIQECKISYEYTNVGSVEEFSVMEDGNNNLE